MIKKAMADKNAIKYTIFLILMNIILLAGFLWSMGTHSSFVNSILLDFTDFQMAAAVSGGTVSIILSYILSFINPFSVGIIILAAALFLFKVFVLQSDTLDKKTAFNYVNFINIVCFIITVCFIGLISIINVQMFRFFLWQYLFYFGTTYCLSLLYVTGMHRKKVTNLK